MQTSTDATMEFHVSRKARDLYRFDEDLFSSKGNVIFANFHAARVFAQRINSKRDLINFPEQAIRAGQINAMGLIDEIMHMVVNLYRKRVNPQVMQQGLEWLNGMLGQETVDATLRRFAEEFPPLAVYRREVELEEYLEGRSAGAPNRQLLLEEMLVLWLANSNPAFSPFLELFDDSQLDKETAYSKVFPLLHAFFETQPTFGPDNQNLVDLLRSPAIAVPHSIPGQLEYIRQRWGALLGKYLYRLLSSLDLISEEEKAFFIGPGPSRVYDFAGLELESERFSPDRDWMPSLVLIAKNTYVWLDQLSKRYNRALTRLDQIPDEELDQLARWGFTGLWLIGVWERSSASKQIKQMRGNPDAVASAYSLFDYQIAHDLGGEVAYENLREKAWQRGIRMASDMVPNHMGIDSRWVTEHPDWFVSLEYSPFPSYSYNGPNLSWHDRVGIYLEDHYYDNSDAAVVFKRVDNWSDEAKYIYHGNDGTATPWNDTAQLNYLKPEVREAVIQTILHVARKFPVIRFDAAMTLAKKHYQRLWFPEPGTGGAIPSRAEHGLTKAQFDELMPAEFWREVVDRVAQEVPDTLLLAEAFWLMEGYFVRTLGMHRVYNSAFMNMMRDEKNAEYRLVMKNTLEFDPEILKRYVNFMNNPDERTAVEQFGKGDKYFGVCIMLATLPGLPMLGHGQVEGYTEKYGMEYRRAYWDEVPDRTSIDRHEREVFPLLRRRYLFAEVMDFLLYDFFTPEGSVNEDVFAYSNRAGDERSLVIYHNKFATAKGWIRNSTAFSVKKGPAGERTLVQKTLAEGLGLSKEANYFCIFRDHVSGLEFIRNNQELHDNGLFVELEAYKYNVFLGFHEVPDNEWQQYANLAAYLDGRGVPNIEEALKEVFLQPIHHPFGELVNAGMFQWLVENRWTEENSQPDTFHQAIQEAEQKSRQLLKEIKRLSNGHGDEQDIAKEIRDKLSTILQLPVLQDRLPDEQGRELQSAFEFLEFGVDGKEEGSTIKLESPLKIGEHQVWGTLLGWLFTHNLGKVVRETDYEEVSRSWIDEWLLGRIVAKAMTVLGLDEGAAWRSVAMVKLLTKHRDWRHIGLSAPVNGERAYQVLHSWLNDNEVQQYLQVNRYQGVLWYNKESLDQFLWWMYTLAVIEVVASSEQETVKHGVRKSEVEKSEGKTREALPVLRLSQQAVGEILELYGEINAIQSAGNASAYKIERLVEAVKA